jgi:predicted dehydrogenase
MTIKGLRTNPGLHAELNILNTNKETLHMQRRSFLGTTVAAGAAVGVGRGSAANDRLSIGIMGCGGRMNHLIEFLLERSDIHVKYVCDVDPSKFTRPMAAIEDATGKMPERVSDFRRMLDDPDLDIVFIAINHHWHPLATIMACQAGKHVYVEKPFSQSIWEGQKMVEAARKYNRVVQVGTQNRSFGYLREAGEFLRSGGIGKIHQVRIINHAGRPALGGPPKVRPIPEGLDYDMYCGPAPLAPYRGRWNYRNLWDFGTGNIWDNAIHHTDVIRFVLGLGIPQSVQSDGGVLVSNDGREIPDSMVTTWNYDGLMVHLHATSIAPYKGFVHRNEVALTDKMPNWKFISCPLEIYGTEGYMDLSRHGGGWVAYGNDAGVIKTMPGRADMPGHIGNFLDCVRTGERPNADVELAQESHIMAHMSNISYRVGKRRLEWDNDKMQFINDDEANAMIKRTYRKPWVVPEEV